ncbi:MAG TPA: transporter [Sphingobium sp.]|nr:transporter [Sphingobium sp.]
MHKAPILAVTLAIAAPAAARNEERDLCADRPGLGTPACTLEQGRAAIELGIGDWTRDQEGPVRSDTLQFGTMLLRVGLSHSTEAQFGWVAFGHVRKRESTTRSVSTQSSVGDITLALRHNLRNPDGSDLSLALMPYLTLPTGGGAIGAGDWGMGLIVPVTIETGGAASFALTARIDAVPDSDRAGRHLGYGAVAGLGLHLSDALSTNAELSLYRDRDPTGHATRGVGGISFAWQDSSDSQWDIGANIGLNRETPDFQCSIGYMRRF